MHPAAGETGPSGGKQPDALTLGVARPRGGARSSTEPTEQFFGLPAGPAPRVACEVLQTFSSWEYGPEYLDVWRGDVVCQAAREVVQG